MCSCRICGDVPVDGSELVGGAHHHPRGGHDHCAHAGLHGGGWYQWQRSVTGQPGYGESCVGYLAGHLTTPLYIELCRRKNRPS